MPANTQRRDAAAQQPLLESFPDHRYGTSDSTSTHATSPPPPPPPPPSSSHKRAQDVGLDTTKHKTFRIATAMLCFSAMGMLVSTIGLMLPSLEAHYHLNDAQVSLIFTVSPLGYILATFLTRAVHTRFGRRGIALIGPSLQLVATLGAGSHPRSYALFVGFLGVGSVGVGLLDGAWCSWVGGSMGDRANTVSGMLHGSFSIGAGLGPLLGGLVMVEDKLEWWVWYYILAGVTAVECVIAAIAFRNDSAQKYLEEQAFLALDATISHDSEDPRTALLDDGVGVETAIVPDVDTAKPVVLSSDQSQARAILTHPVVWICAAFLLVEVGVESSISGWVVLFLRRTRHAPVQLAAAGSSAFWIGEAVGRLSLGIVTDRYGLRRAVTLYLLAVVGFSVGFALLGLSQDSEQSSGAGGVGAKVSVALVAMIGVFSGPIFPSSIVQLTSALPRELHVGAVTYVAMTGQVGGALLPVALGILIQGLGVEVFPFVVVVQTVLGFMFWLLFARVAARHEGGRQ